MLGSVRHLFSYAWANLVSALGTTTLSILLFSFAIPVLIFVVAAVVGWREKRRAGKSVKEIIKGSLLSRQTIIPSTIYLLVWTGLLGWSLSNTAYKEHLALLGRIGTLVSQNRTVKSENDGLREENQRLKSMPPKTMTIREPSSSLRRRTMQLADEMQKYLLGRANDPNRPPFAVPNSSDTNRSEEQKRAIERYRKYEQETLDYYFAHYRDRMVGIIKEYDSKGVKTGYLESTARQFPPVFAMPGSAGEGTYMDTLYQFRELAYHVDGIGNLIVITP